MHIFEIVYMHGIRRSKDARIAAVTRMNIYLIKQIDSHSVRLLCWHVELVALLYILVNTVVELYRVK
jgi:hypothetical protein